MNKTIAACVIAGLVACGCSDDRQTQRFAPTGKKASMSDYRGPQDTPTEHTERDILAKRQPFVDQAKKTYAEARQRYLAGLPRGSSFFVTVDFKEGNVQENAYIAVRAIEGNQIRGVVSTKLLRIKSRSYAEELTFPESEVIDWTITSADGKEEGNFVGKFLDEYNAGRL
jgi:uncharacterized protein YegJ (DUF2314 family)